MRWFSTKAKKEREDRDIKALANECQEWANYFKKNDETEKEARWLRYKEEYLAKLNYPKTII